MKSMCETLFQVCGLSVCQISKQSITETFSAGTYANVIINNFISSSFYPPSETQRCPLDYFLSFAAIADETNQDIYILGPYLRMMPGKNKCAEYMRLYHIRSSETAAFLHFMRTLPMYPGHTDELLLEKAYTLINHHLPAENVPFSATDALKKYACGPVENIPVSADTKEENYAQLQQTENRLLGLIQCGNPSGLLDALTKEPYAIHRFPSGSDNRDVYYTALVSITLASRAAIEGGLEYSVGLQLCDMYIHHLEQLHTQNEMLYTISEAYMDFASRVQAYKFCLHYSPLIRKCIQYLLRMDFEHSSLSSMALRLSVNASYLSRTFSQEVGVTYQQYVNRLKIREACRLLRDTQITIAEISNLLQYSSQGYFQNMFKKFIGTTPSEYRRHPSA